MKIALGLEYPLALRGGVGVLVETLIQGLAGHFEIVLVSPDPPGFSHPRNVRACVLGSKRPFPRVTSRNLALRLESWGFPSPTFILGENYGWGSRIPGQSPFPFLSRCGIASITTIHMALSILDGYCDPKKSLWFKLAFLPVAWLGKLQVLRHVGAEIVISQRACEKLRRWYWPLRSRFAVFTTRDCRKSRRRPAGARSLDFGCWTHCVSQRPAHSGGGFRGNCRGSF